MKKQNDVIYYYLRRHEKWLFNSDGKQIFMHGCVNKPDGSEFKQVRIPYGTVAMRRNDDGTVNRGIALCSRKDNFCKNTGRKKAFARLRKVESTKANHETPEYRGRLLKASNPYFTDEKITLGFFHDAPSKKEVEILR